MTRETALKILKETHDEASFSLRTALETFIPELSESESERTRKELMDIVRKSYGFGGFTLNSKKDFERYISYLERLKECYTQDEVYKIRKDLYQSGWNDGYKHGLEDSQKLK